MRGRPTTPGAGTTRQLGRLLAPGGDGRADVPADPVTWARLLGVADRHRLVPALAVAGLDAGWLPRVPSSARRAVDARSGPGASPPAVALLDTLERNRTRVAALLEQGRAVLEALDRAGVPAVPLKGLDALLAGRYPDPAARTMTDLDVLVPEAGATEAWQAVRAIGFEPVAAPAAEHHLAPLARPGEVGSVELHTAVLRGRWGAGLPASGLLARSGPAPDGEPGRRLARADSLAVLVAHAQLQDEGRVLLELPLRALHETAMELARGEGGPGPDVWADVAERLGRLGPGGALALEEHLWLVAALFGAPSSVTVRSVALRHGRLVLAVADHPRARAVLGQLAFLPRSFSAERMVALHGGPPSGLGLWWTRARHAADGLARRASRLTATGSREEA